MSARTPFRPWSGAVGTTVVLILLIALAVGETVDNFSIGMVGVVIVSIVTLAVMFPGSLFFTLALANFLGVYACLFTFLKLTNFPDVGSVVAHAGFVMPVLSFLAGTLFHHRAIQDFVASERTVVRGHLARAFVWLIPVAVIAKLTFLVPALSLTPGQVDAIFLGAMGLASLIVFLSSRYVAAFLIDTGLMFEGFFVHIRRLAVPAFAFITLYSLLVIVFACLYRLLEVATSESLFRIGDEVRDITFPEALYFSVSTLSTVGYGDIVPLGNLMRLVAVFEVVAGVLLFMFGVSELLTYARERRKQSGADT